LAWLIVVAACHEPADVRDAEPATQCEEMQYAASFVDSSVFGPVSGTSFTVPLAPTIGGELLVVSLASPTGQVGSISMTGGKVLYQVATAQETCGKTAVIATVGNIEPGVSQFTVQTSAPQPDPPPTFVAFVMRFAGLPAETGATLSYNFGESRALAACPGSVIVSTATSCGGVSLPPASDFTALDVVDGMAAAYYIPTAAGEYAARWESIDTVASAIVELK
jgi:hypothetical protein